MSDIIDLQFYKAVHTDLKNLNDTKLIDHWRTHGKHEKRMNSPAHFQKLYPNFDIAVYRRKNPQLSVLSDYQIMYHFHVHDITVSASQVVVKREKVLLITHIANGNDEINCISLTLLTRIVEKYSSRYDIDVYITYIESCKTVVNEILQKLQKVNNLKAELVDNLGADLHSYINFITSNNKTYDFLVKLHSKTIASWTIDLVSAVCDLDRLSEYFSANPKCGVVGSADWTLPVYAYGSASYNDKLYNILKDLFSFTRDERNLDYTGQVEKLMDVSFDVREYIDINSDIYKSVYSEQHAKDHAQGSLARNEKRRGLCNLNDYDAMKYISGTIFAMRGDLLLKYKQDNIAFVKLMNSIKSSNEIGYVSDECGTHFTFTHASERIVQVLAYKYGYTVNGITHQDIDLCEDNLHIKAKRMQSILICLHDTKQILLLFDIVCDLAKNGFNVTIVVENIESNEDNNIKEFESKFNKHAKVIILNCNSPRSPLQTLKLIDKARELILNTNPDMVLIYGLSAVHYIYAAYDHSQKIILYACEDNQTDILSLFNTQGLISYDFLDYVDLCIAKSPVIAQLLNAWMLSNSNSNSNINCNKQILIENENSTTNIKSLIITKISDNIAINSKPLLNVNYSLSIDRYTAVPKYTRYTLYPICNDELLSSIRTIDDACKHYYTRGLLQNKVLYRLPVRCKKTILFVIHEGSLTGAPKVGCLIGNYLQNNFNVIMLSMKGDEVLKSYLWEHPPIVMQHRKSEYKLSKYIDKLDVARKIIDIVKPDLVYINSTAAHVFYHACLDYTIPAIYSTHEGPTGLESQLQAYIFPFPEFFKGLSCKNTLFYSCSPLCTQSLFKCQGVSSDIPVSEFQTFDIEMIVKYGNIKCSDDMLLHSNFNSKILFGMVGSRGYRKGYDIFVELASKMPQHDFVWIGGADLEINTGKIPNIRIIDSVTNPYNLIKQFDYMLLTSREDMAPLVVTEAVLLNVPTIMCQPNISCWEYYKSIGCTVLEQESCVETWTDLVNDINNNKLKYIANYNTVKLKEYDIRTVASNITADIVKITGGLLSGSLRKYHRHFSYGTSIYDAEETRSVIDEFMNKSPNITDFDHIKYACKYKELVKAGLVTEAQLKDHYVKVGYESRNCKMHDWKLFLVLHPELMRDFIDSESKVNAAVKNIYCTVNFDWKEYIKNNDDLSAAKFTEAQALNHWRQHGVYEGRSCKGI